MTRACRACGSALAGPYCQACGQPSAEAPRTLREVLAGQTGRLAHTLLILVTAPGELAREIDEARDRRSLRPISLLLNLVAIFFLLTTFTGFGPEAVRRADVSGQVATAIAERAAQSRLAREVFDERLAHRFQTAYTLLLPVIALAYGGAIGVTHWRRKSWLVPLAAGIQYLCFSYLWLGPLFLVLWLLEIEAYGRPSVLALQFAVGWVYLTLLCRRIYDERWTAAAVKSLAILLAGAAVHNLTIVAAVFAALASFPR